MCVYVKILRPNGEVPVRMTKGSAGADLFLPCDVTVRPGVTVKVPMGFAMELPKGTFGLIKLRSSTDGVRLAGSGVIDEDYRGEVHLKLEGTSSTWVTCEAGRRIAQLLVLPWLPGKFSQVDGELSDTTRGEGGFGHTGR